MMADKLKTPPEFQHRAYGSYGDFAIPAGKVGFLQTIARIGSHEPSREQKLARELRPVREVLPTHTMNFNQLLQRDLDDHRVATELVPYVLESARTGPAFFPPIVAAVLPFEGETPCRGFPEVKDAIDEKGGFTWKAERYGKALEIARVFDQNDDDENEFLLPLGRVSWNPEQTKLVVIDGQHRAMALLAIDRTLSNGWVGRAKRYKGFYESSIRKIIDVSAFQKEKDGLDLSFPVTLVWFPEQTKNAFDHQGVARKLFVDVNRNARRPSQSRILLLSDTELCSIFTRSILNQLRDSSQGLPIAAVEYDHPGRDQASYAKWSAVTNATIIHACIERSLFGTTKRIDAMTKQWRKANAGEEAEFMRLSLEVAKEMKENVDGFDRSDVSNTNFPASAVPLLTKQFMRGWGTFIVTMLGELLPYRVHGSLLRDVEREWTGTTQVAELAKEALFEGVGMYWTIRDSANHWEAAQLRKELSHANEEETELVKAWKVIATVKEDFEKRRIKKFLDLGDDDELEPRISEPVIGAYDVFSTSACQLGFVLAARVLALRQEIGLGEMKGFTDAVMKAANAGLSGVTRQGLGRQTVLWSGHHEVANFNVLVKLDTSMATYFRYFWLEVLATPEAVKHLKVSVKPATLYKARDEGRAGYWQYIKSHKERGLKRERRVLPEKPAMKESIVEEARLHAKKTLSDALKEWFKVDDKAFNKWYDEFIVKPKGRKH